MKEAKKTKKGKGGAFIPAFLFVGMGVGFLINDLVAGMFIGLGAGFLAFTVSLFFEK